MTKILLCALAVWWRPSWATGILNAQGDDSVEQLHMDDECSADNSDCAINALQLRGERLVQTAGEQSSCHTAAPGEKCYGEVEWAMNTGLKTHPEWYGGLTAKSSFAEFQAAVHSSAPGKCPMPCGVKVASKWCSSHGSPTLWKPNTEGEAMNVRVLSYNLFWWSLFRNRKGNHDSASKLIAKAHKVQPVDFMGFQECEDIDRVLGPMDLSKEFAGFAGPHAICMAYRKSAWKLLDRGSKEVAEDMPTRWYGKRGTQWMRLQHTETGKFAFFVNHHGPLSINSGGKCGGSAVSDNIVTLMGTKARPGDLLLLVGDFNANAASLTVQGLWHHLTHVYAGDSFGGVDNVFSNIDQSFVLETSNLGSGGSDHNAIAATVQVAPAVTRLTASQSIEHEPAGAVEQLTGKYTSGDSWETYWCGRMESDVLYHFEPGVWSSDVIQRDPDRCCRACQNEPRCKAFIWASYVAEVGGPQCQMRGGRAVKRSEVSDVVSGMPAASAAEAASAAAMALR